MNESPMLTLDKTALQAPVSDQEASAEAPRRLRAADGGDEGAAGVTTSAVVRVVVLVLGAWALAVVFVRMVQLPFGAPNISIFTICVAALMVVPIAVAQVRGLGVGMRDMHRTWYRLARFADANQLEYSIRRAQVPEGATLFRFADKGVATDVVTRSRPREFEAANYAFDTWAGRTRMPHSSAYVAFRLSTPAPAMTLVTASSAGGALVWTPDPGQRTIEIPALAGRFDVRCAPGDEDAVRRMLTARLCEQLIALAGDVDVEMVGDRIHFIARRAAPMQDPAFWEWVEDLSRMLDAEADVRPETSACRFR